ncbi:MAG TPA: hypothetical protein ENK82_07365, partial [Campylobacterales bacterium]|nr:hypothetical protein [Campylobacterales bacterium]
MKKSTGTFNPNDFDSITTIAEIAPQFKELYAIDFKKISLEKTLLPLNYEIISSDYIDFEFSSIEEYFALEVDKV